MKITIGIVLFLVVVTASWANWGDPLPPGLIGLLQSQSDKSVCRCEYYKSPNYGQLVLTRNCDLNDPKRALMKIDGKFVELSQVKTNNEPACNKGTPFKEVWSSPGIIVILEGTITGLGEESCWAKGKLIVEKGQKKQIMHVEGACGI